MYIVSWLKGHPIISVWVLGLIAFLLYWSGSTNSKNTVLEDHPVALESNELVKNELQTSLKNVAGDTKINIQKSTEKTEANEISVVDQAKSGGENIITDIAKNNKKSVTNVVSSGNSDLNNDLAKQSQQISSSDSVVTNGPFKGNKELSGNLASKEVITDLSTSSKEDMLLIAREAYWNNGLDEAAEIYQKLIKLEPNVLDHKGELGNVYWRQGFPKKAAELYSEIAIPMIKDGKSEPVANMLGFIGLFYPDRAAQINDHLQVREK